MKPKWLTDMRDEKTLASLRNRMVEEQIAARGVKDARVLAAMREVRRHEFILDGDPGRAYEDRPLPIGSGQTISQPYIVAWMSELLRVEPDMDVLEIGTGCGYQTAVLCRLARHIYSLEFVPELSRQAAVNLQRAGCGNATLRVGNGRDGWPEARTFPRIIAAAATRALPEKLMDQLAPGGRMVLPVGGAGMQQMTVVEKHESGEVDVHELGRVSFVPLV